MDQNQFPHDNTDGSSLDTDETPPREYTQKDLGDIYRVTIQEPTNSKRRKLIWIVVSVFVGLLIFGGIWFLAIRGTEDSQRDSSRDEVSQAHQPVQTSSSQVQNYDSPIGLLPPFHEGRVRSGQFKLSYAAGEQTFERRGAFTVSDAGEVMFDTISNIDKVNKLLKYLAEKDEYDKIIPAEEFLATKYSSYNFSDIVQYSALHEPLDFFSGFIARINMAKSGADNELTESVTLSKDCDVAYAEVQRLTGNTSLNTNAMRISVDRNDSEYVLSLDDSPLRDANAAILDMLAKCFGYTDSDMTQTKEMLKATSSSFPKIAYRQLEPGRWQMDVGVGSAKLIFEVWDLLPESLDISIRAKSFLSAANRYGSLYDRCRVPPTVTTDFMASYSYDFLPETDGYRYPSLFDSGYYCAPSLVPPGYSPSRSVLDTEDAYVRTEGSTLTVLATFVEVRYYAEQVFSKEGHYPALDKLVSESKAKSGIFGRAKVLFDEKKLLYEPLPKGCQGKSCDDYIMTLYVGRGTINANSYQHNLISR